MRTIWNQLWNQRRSNAWILVELTVVNVLLWYAIDLVYNYEGAAWQPKGYDTDCVFDLQMTNKPLEMLDDNDNRNAGEDFRFLYNLIKDYPGVEQVGYYYGSVPYSDEVMFEGYASHTDSVRTVNCKIRYVSPEYIDIFRLSPIAGNLNAEKWKAAENPTPVLMSVELADSLFGTQGADAVGKTCFNPYWLKNPNNPKTNYRVMAVLPSHKLDEYQRYEPFIYLPTPVPEALWWQHVVIRVHPDYVAGFAERFRKDMQGVFDRGIFYLKHIRSYADMKETFDIEQGTVSYLNTTYAVIAFFVFNVFLSILSTFWFRTRRRRSEIALRMAMGCSRWGVLKHYLTEGFLLLTVAAIPALIICLNIQIGNLTVQTLMDTSVGRFIGCFAVSIMILYVIVAIGISIPARKAMKVHPAEALRDE